MATHSSILAWRIPGMGEPGGLLSMGLHRVRHDWSDLAAAAAGGIEMLQERGTPFQGPKVGSSNTRKWIVWGETCVDKASDFIGKGRLDEEQEGKGTQENCSAMWLEVSGFMMVILSQSFWLRVLPGGRCIVQPRWMPSRRILGGGWTRGVTFWPFPNSSSWWWLISSVFLTRASWCKITHANGYYAAWPEWAVSVSVLLRTTPPWETLYSRYFLGIGVEFSFFCNFFLLCMGGGLPTRAEASLYLI